MLVVKNHELKGLEVSFDRKPSVAVLETLKANGFRWHRAKRLWYAKETAKRVEVLNALSSKNTVKPQEKDTVVENKYGVKVGDIFLLSFGYSMTLYDFFQVVSVTESSCRVVEINAPCTHGDPMQPRYKAELGKKYAPKANSMWIKDQAKGDLKRVTVRNGYMHIAIGEYWAYPYDGREVEEDHWD